MDGGRTSEKWWFFGTWELKERERAGKKKKQQTRKKRENVYVLGVGPADRMTPCRDSIAPHAHTHARTFQAKAASEPDRAKGEKRRPSVFTLHVYLFTLLSDVLQGTFFQTTEVQIYVYAD